MLHLVLILCRVLNLVTSEFYEDFLFPLRVKTLVKVLLVRYN